MKITCKSGKGREINPEKKWENNPVFRANDDEPLERVREQWASLESTVIEYPCLTASGEVPIDRSYEAELVWQQNTALGWVTLTAKHDEGYRPEIHRQVYIIQPTESGKEQKDDLIAKLALKNFIADAYYDKCEKPNCLCMELQAQEDNCSVYELKNYRCRAKSDANEPMKQRSKPADAVGENQYWDCFDEPHKQLHQGIHELVSKHGWKDFYFAAKKYNDKVTKSKYKIPTP